MAITRERLRSVFGIEEPSLRLATSRIEDKGTYVLERLQFETGDGTRIRGFLTRPVDGGPHPALVYAHSHGGKHAIGASELIEGREYLLSPALGPVFAEAGYVTLMLDMPAFGERATVTESAAAKAAMWYGKSLFGQMLSENAAAVTWLGTREDVDPKRIGMFGMSMGCTLSYWLAAVDERIAAVAHLCCYCDLATLVEMGQQDLHGIYLTVPGLLAETTTGEIAGLVAPRPQLICIGEADPLTPPLAVDRALEVTRAMYGAGPLEVFRQPGIAHQETPQMRSQVLDFFRRTLQ
jgi:dienelactone hydrolase